jgi:hypothetical protein
MVGRQGCRLGAVVGDRGLAQGREQEQDEGSNSCQYGHNIFFRTKVYLALHLQLYHVVYFLCTVHFCVWKPHVPVS